MNANEISLLEAFHNTFFNFTEDLKKLTWDASEIWQWANFPYIAGDLQYSILNGGEYVLRCAGEFLNKSDRTNITLFLDKVASLPDDALRANEDALDHPRWKELRRDARDLLEQLERPITENRAFFAKPA